MTSATLRSLLLKFVLRQDPRAVYSVWLSVSPAGDVHIWLADVHRT